MSGILTDDQVHVWLQQVADAGWLSLHFESPGMGGVSRGEIDGGGYKRVKVAFSQPTNRAIWSLTDAKFTDLTENRLTHFGIWSSQYRGMLRAYGELPEPKLVVNGWGFVIHADELAVSIG